MSNLNTIDFISMDYVIENIDIYKKIFIKDGIIAFRNANLSYEDHVKIHDIFGKALGSYRDTNTSGYVENHSNTYERGPWTSAPGPDDIILPWHIEHPTYQNRIVLGTWNMYKFNIDSENGKTYFVDNKALYSLMPDSLKEFSKKCIILDPDPIPGNNHQHFLISSHWLTDEPVIDVSHIFQMADSDTVEKNNFPKLSTFDGKDPSQSEKESYFEVMTWIHDQLYKNLDVRIVHKWRQGDLVVPDMSRMCHAVTGGFRHEDREFRGIWGYRFSFERARS